MSRKLYNKIEYFKDDEVIKLINRLRDGISLLFEYDFRHTGYNIQWNPNKEEDNEESSENNIKERQEIVMDIAASLGVPFEYGKSCND